MEEVFVIVAKSPIEGFAKTRLAKEIGDQSAIKLYRAFMEDFFSSLSEKFSDKKKYLFITPSEDKDFTFFKDLSKKTNCKFDIMESQGEGSLFERIKKIFQKIEQESPAYIHLTGTDIPDFPFDIITSAIDKEVITIGPDFDGGYYYIGAKSDCDFMFDLTDFKSEEVSDKTIGLIKKNQKEYKVVKTWSDIDCLDDFYETINRDRMGLLHPLLLREIIALSQEKLLLNLKMRPFFRIDCMSDYKGRFNLFFLNFNDELPAWYRASLEYFFDKGINVIDIDENGFQSLLSQGENFHLLVIAPNKKIAEKMEKKLQSSALGMAVRSKRVNLFYLSAVTTQFAFSLATKQKNFFFISMPLKIDMDMMVKRIRNILDNSFSMDNRWPGGKRSGLLDLWEKK